jgi:arylsulfatase A-like enzyme
VSVTVHRKEQIYSGDFLAEAPELVIAMDDHRTEVMAELGSEGLFVSSDARNGTHTPDGFLIAKGPGIPAGQRTEASLLDIAPTALHLMGIPIPEESDGEVLLRIYAENAEPRRRPVERDQVGPYGPTGDPGTVYTEEELRQVEKQLRDLGYLG